MLSPAFHALGWDGQVFSSRSTLGYLVPSASPARAAVRVANSSAGAATASRSRRWATKPARVREGDTRAKLRTRPRHHVVRVLPIQAGSTSCGPVEELTQRIGRDEPGPAARTERSLLSLISR